MRDLIRLIVAFIAHHVDAAILAAIYGFAIIVLILAAAGCDSPRGAAGLDRAAGRADTIDGTLDTIRYHAEAARKELR